MSDEQEKPNAQKVLTDRERVCYILGRKDCLVEELERKAKWNFYSSIFFVLMAGFYWANQLKYWAAAFLGFSFIDLALSWQANKIVKEYKEERGGKEEKTV